MSLNSFFAPKSIAIIGVSRKTFKLGSIILQNVVDSGYTGDLYGVNPKLAGQQLCGKDCYASLVDLPSPVDLAVVVVPGKIVETIIDNVVATKARNVIIISAGFSEIGEGALEDRIRGKCEHAGINLLGPNCLGAIFPYVNLNASFSDGFPARGNICFVSQSGAFCTAMLDWSAQKGIGFSHFVSLGNKAGISELEILESLAGDPQVKIFAFYLESLKHGNRFVDLIRATAPEKPVVILEPGRSAKAAEASSSHTGSLAPNARILEKAYESAGAIQVFSMRAMFSVLELLTWQSHKNFGRNLAILTNAGGVGVLTSDLTEEADLDLVAFEAATSERLAETLPIEANIKNPVDIIGDARADRYQQALEILVEDGNVDQILVLLTPQRTTEIEATAQIVADTAPNTDKNVVASFIGGQKCAAGLRILERERIPNFEFPVDATRVLGTLARHKGLVRSMKTIRAHSPDTADRQRIKGHIDDALRNGFPSLPQAQVDEVLSSYGADLPRSGNFTDLPDALEFANSILPRPIVMKLSAPKALHKTEYKGVRLGIETPEEMQRIWDALWSTIDEHKIPDASIQIQEQIADALEIILGANTDPNFGKILLCGHGGIYTEVWQDTEVEILPVRDFESMLDGTRIGKILDGYRGKTFAKNKLVETLEKVQSLVQDFPEIQSIDANPLLVTKDRAVCVDFKIILK